MIDTRHSNEENSIYSENIDVEQAMHGAQDFFAWDDTHHYQDDELNLQVV